MAENFFSILKTECIYRYEPATFSEANEMIDRYIYFYNHERIQLKTGEASLARRLSTLILFLSCQGSFCAVRTTWGCSQLCRPCVPVSEQGRTSKVLAALSRVGSRAVRIILIQRKNTPRGPLFRPSGGI